MKIHFDVRRWGVLAGGLLAAVLGMPNVVRAEGPIVVAAEATQGSNEGLPGQIANSDEQTGSSGDEGNMEENRRRRRCYYYYDPGYVYYYQPVWYYYPAVTYTIVTPTVAPQPTAPQPTAPQPTIPQPPVTVPTYSPPAVSFNVGSPLADGNSADSDQVADGLQRPSGF